MFLVQAVAVGVYDVPVPRLQKLDRFVAVVYQGPLWMRGIRLLADYVYQHAAPDVGKGREPIAVQYLFAVAIAQRRRALCPVYQVYFTVQRHFRWVLPIARGLATSIQDAARGCHLGDKRRSMPGAAACCCYSPLALTLTAAPKALTQGARFRVTRRARGHVGSLLT